MLMADGGHKRGTCAGLYCRVAVDRPAPGANVRRATLRAIIPVSPATRSALRSGDILPRATAARLALTMPASAPCWDIFCAVVDNYGDVGVAWRLARQLAGEHNLAVRLFVTDLAVLARLAPQDRRRASAQMARGVAVRRWVGPHADLTEVPGAVVVEAFGCGLPRLISQPWLRPIGQPLWINLEYLSAETWIESCHGLASRHPTLPLTRYFYFPGFSATSGGLLRERDLFARRDRFRADPGARDTLWRMLGRKAPATGTLVVSLFCYATAALPSLLDAWVEGNRPLLCLVPEGVAQRSLERWIGERSAGRCGARARPTRAGGGPLLGSGRLRPVAVGLRPQPRAWGGFVPPRAMGGASRWSGTSIRRRWMRTA